LQEKNTNLPSKVKTSESHQTLNGNPKSQENKKSDVFQALRVNNCQSK
jgi:hypothetical protein